MSLKNQIKGLRPDLIILDDPIIRNDKELNVMTFFCTDCKHHTRKGKLIDRLFKPTDKRDKCMHPTVVGNGAKVGADCVSQRTDKMAACGPEGSLWEAK